MPATKRQPAHGLPSLIIITDFSLFATMQFVPDAQPSNPALSQLPRPSMKIQVPLIALSGALTVALLGAPSAVDASRPLIASHRALPHEVAVEFKGDAEPVDPAEQRPAIMPPPRPESRAGGTWVQRGPAPTETAQVTVPPNNQVSGAVQAIVPHPTDANTLYAGAVNGGIWKTTNALAASPTWVPQTDNMQSLSIGSMSMDPLDVTRQTLIAGTGRFSNFAQRGDDEIGVYYTTNGGGLWTHLGAPTLVGKKLIAVAARGPILLAAAQDGLYRSVNTSTFSLTSGLNGLPTGPVLDLQGDPGNNLRFYIVVDGVAPQVLTSIDSGLTWTNITAGVGGLGTTTTAARISIGAGGVVFIATINSGVLAAVSRSINQGANWTPMDVPAVHPGSQGNVNTAIAADPANNNLIYISGDRITTGPFTGNVQRGNASLAAGSQFASIVNAGGGNTAPHADSRDMSFDANGNLLQSDDGGVYRRASPTSSAGVWSSVIGNLAITEVHDVAHDRVANILMIGTQDNGTHQQFSSASQIWDHINGGDGGDVSIDDVSRGALGSFRFMSSQSLGGLRRQASGPTNSFEGNVNLGTVLVTDPQFVTPVELSYSAPTRMLIGGSTTVYESVNANAATPTLASLGGPGANRNAIAYGANGAPDAAYVGSGIAVHRRSGNVFVPTTALPAGAATLTDVAMDPDSPALVFAIDNDQVFRSTDSGGTWTDVTGNLTAISSLDFRTIEFIPSAGGDRVAIGTRSGVFSAPANSAVWSLFGAGLPNVLVFDLRYLLASQTLIAGTLGRGVWSTTLGPADILLMNGFE